MSEIGISCFSCPCCVMETPKLGYCHGRPPTPFLVQTPPAPITGQTVRIQSIWAPVGEKDWCAKHPLFGSAIPIDDRLSVEAKGTS
jgi:hypothetical protein